MHKAAKPPVIAPEKANSDPIKMLLVEYSPELLEVSQGLLINTTPANAKNILMTSKI